jgi:mono/diheme cytochrome c family protein
LISNVRIAKGESMRSAASALSVVFMGAMTMLSHPATGEPATYNVVEGTKVDEATLGGWRAWRALACERCHGAQQEGLVGPSLIESMKQLSQEDFKRTVLQGRSEKGMPNFSSSEMASKNIAGLYAYLKGRSDGAIQPGRLEALK